MKIIKPPSWPTTEEEAIAIQEELRHQVITEDRLGNVGCVAGVDVDYNDADNLCQGAVVVLSFPQLEIIDKAIAQRPISFPYQRIGFKAPSFQDGFFLSISCHFLAFNAIVKLV